MKPDRDVAHRLTSTLLYTTFDPWRKCGFWRANRPIKPCKGRTLKQEEQVFIFYTCLQLKISSLHLHSRCTWVSFIDYFLKIQSGPTKKNGDPLLFSHFIAIRNHKVHLKKQWRLIATKNVLRLSRQDHGRIAAGSRRSQQDRDDCSRVF